MKANSGYATHVWVRNRFLSTTRNILNLLLWKKPTPEHKKHFLKRNSLPSTKLTNELETLYSELHINVQYGQPVAVPSLICCRPHSCGTGIPTVSLILTLTLTLTRAICTQNLTIVAWTVQEISLGTSKFNMDHVTLITPLLRVICHPYVGTWHSLHACKSSGDMLGVHQNLNRSRDLTTRNKLDFSISTHYEDKKAIQNIENWMVWGS